MQLVSLHLIKFMSENTDKWVKRKIKCKVVLHTKWTGMQKLDSVHLWSLLSHVLLRMPYAGNL